MSGIMGDEDNPQEERLDSVIQILSGATEEVREAPTGALLTRGSKKRRMVYRLMMLTQPVLFFTGFASVFTHAHGMLATHNARLD